MGLLLTTLSAVTFPGEVNPQTEESRAHSGKKGYFFGRHVVVRDNPIGSLTTIPSWISVPRFSKNDVTQPGGKPVTPPGLRNRYPSQTIWNGGTYLSATCLWQPKLRRYTVNKVPPTGGALFHRGFISPTRRSFIFWKIVAARRSNHARDANAIPAWVPGFAKGKGRGSLAEHERACRVRTKCR